MTLSTGGPGVELGTMLVRFPPESSSLANGKSDARLEPVKTPSTGSKLLPVVLMNDVGDAALNEHVAVHVHQTLGVPTPTPSRSEGSPVSAVAPTLEPDAMMEPAPMIANRFSKLSFDGVV